MSMHVWLLGQSALRKHGLRGLVFIFSLTLHGLAYSAFLPSQRIDENAPIEGLELSIAPPQGESAADEPHEVDSRAQAEAAASIPQSEPPTAPVQESVEAAKVENNDADVMEAATTLDPSRIPPPPEQKPEKPEIEKVETVSATQAANAAEETFARRDLGVENGVQQSGGVTRAAYAAAVKKAIAKNRRRPHGDERGTVSISFLIGPSGTAEQIEVVKSAGSSLNETARSIVAALRLPPPPDRTFSGTIAIKFE